MATGMALAGEATQTATRRFVAGFWEAHRGKRSTHRQAIGLALLNLGDTLGRDLSKPGVVEAYTAALEDLTPERCIEVFSRALEQSRFFPSPAELRAFAGLAEAVDSDALKALSEVLAAMRLWGPELKPKPGAIKRDRDDDGLVLVVPERGDEVPAPVFPDRTMFAIVAMGMGSREAGLEALACHPALPWNSQRGQDEAATRAFRSKNAAEIEKRWCVAWAQAGAM